MSAAPARESWIVGAELALAACLGAWSLVGAGGGPGARAPGASMGWVFDPKPAGGFAEARCRYDLSQGPVRVTVEPWAGPLSLSIRTSGGAAIFSADERSAPQGVDVVLGLKGQATPRGARAVISPEPTGVVLERRPAATLERFEEADKARGGDSCGPAGLDFPATPRR